MILDWAITGLISGIALAMLALVGMPLLLAIRYGLAGGRPPPLESRTAAGWTQDPRAYRLVERYAGFGKMSTTLTHARGAPS